MRVFALDDQGRIVARSANALRYSLDRRLWDEFDGGATRPAVEAAVARSWLHDDEQEVLIHDDVLRVMRVPPNTSMIAWVRTVPQPPNHPLTPRELAVLRLLAQNLTVKQIAAALSIAVRTVHDHKDTALAKLGLNNLCAAGVWLRDNGLL